MIAMSAVPPPAPTTAVNADVQNAAAERSAISIGFIKFDPVGTKHPDTCHVTCHAISHFRSWLQLPVNGHSDLGLIHIQEQTSQSLRSIQPVFHGSVLASSLNLILSSAGSVRSILIMLPTLEAKLSSVMPPFGSLFGI
jgi:hypothetical protein